MKALPYNAEYEQSALACALIDQQALLTLLEKTDQEDFYQASYRNIYGCIKSLHRDGKPVDLVTLSACVKDEDRPAMLDLFDSIPSSAVVHYYCDQVAALASRRRAIAALQECLNDLYDIEVADPVASAQSRLLTLGTKKVTDAHQIDSLVDDAFGRAWEAHRLAQSGQVVRASHVNTGIASIDELLTIKRGDMVVIGARPSAGKTSVGVQIALHIASEKPILFFSLEEPATQIADRYLTAMTGVPMRKAQEGRTTSEELDRLADAQASAQYCRLVVNDTPALRVSDMRAIAMRLQVIRGEEWGAIMIDHMIKVRPEDGKAQGHQRLTQVSQDIKTMARVMKVPVIVLTQLRRPQSEDTEPNMSDLRESGSIEEDADSVLLIHRPERDKSYSIAKFLLKKQRTGPCGSLELMFDAERMRFKPLKGFGQL